jgi:HEAT repeat protein
VVKNASGKDLGQIRPLAARLLAMAGRVGDNETRNRVLVLAATLLKHDDASATGCRDLIRNALEDAEPANRAVAAGLAGLPEVALLSLVAPLLDDPSPMVRQAAMLAVGPCSDAVDTDDLLRSLHDADADVRRLCEAALKSRGLRNEDVNLARLVTDSHPAVRLQVLEALAKSNDLEPGVWLRRMSYDTSPAVRAAVLRAATEQYAIDLTDRMDQMAQTDPSQTVRQLAEHYLSRRKSKLAEKPIQ